MFRSYQDQPAKPLFLAFNFDGERSKEYLLPLSSEKATTYRRSKALLKGAQDLQANIQSTEAVEVKQLLAKASPAQVLQFWEDPKLLFNYVHGTHVTGIAVEGNPFARLIMARTEFEWRTQPRAETVALVHSWAQEYRDTVRFFQMHKARVVNMSWGGTLASVEDNLAKNGVGKDPTERKRLAQERFDIERTGLYEAIGSAPEILFVCAAMNNSGDSTFTKTIPASFELPNLLAVGAVDESGNEVDFTNYGPTVKVFANGYNVPSTIPGNDHMIWSGTSMAAPQVTNLAGKLLAVEPTLTTAQLVQLIVAGASTERPSLRLINAKGSLELLRKRVVATVSQR